MVSFSNFLSKILAKYIEYDDAAFTLPENIVNLIQIHYSFLNMSYIYYENHSSWIYIFVILARPSVIIQIPFCYVLGIVYLLAQTFCIVDKMMPGRKIISLINCFLKVGLLNFIIEQFSDAIGLSVGMLILFIQLVEILFVQGTLDINTKNFQLTQISFFKIVSFVLNMMMMIFYKLNFRLRIIQILAITNSGTQIFDLFLIQNYRNPITRMIMLSVQFVTIYVGIMQFIHYENSYTLVVVPFFYKIISQVKISHFLHSDDEIINASILLQQKRFYECFLMLNKIKDQNLLRKIKKNVLLKKCIQFINSDMQVKLQNQQLLGIAEKLIRNDYYNLKISNGIQKMIVWKIKLLQNWKTNEFQEIYKFVDKMLQLKYQIDKYYLSEPNGMVQSLISFFYAEILNDLLEANEMIMGAKKSSDKYIVSAFSNRKMFYIITKYENGQLQINNISSNAPSFICNKKLYDLIPPGVRDCHSKLVDEFITTGQSKYVRTLNQNFINHGSYIDTINFAIDLTYLNQVNFICLISPQHSKTSTLIFDSNKQIACTTNYFQEYSNFKQFFAKGVNINSVFVRDENKNIEEGGYFENVPLAISKFNSLQSDDQSDITYQCCLDVFVRYYQSSMLYIIIRIENIQTVFNNTNSKSNHNNSTKKGLQSSGSSSDRNLSIPEEEIIKANIIQNQELNQLSTQKIMTEDCVKKALHLDIILQNQILTSRGDPEQNLLCEKVQTFSKKQSVKSCTNEEKRNQDKNESHNQKKEDQQVDHEAESQVSSIKMLRNSKFYRKYDLYNKFNKHIPLKGHHQMLISLFVLSIFLQGMFIIIQLSSLNLVSFAVDINLLEIKNRFFQPLDQFLVTRWNLWTYNFQKTNGIITVDQYNSESKYATSNLGLGFDSLNSNLKLVLNRQELQNLLRSKYLDIYSYLDTFKNEQYNMTLRTAISVLLNFQYILKMNYIYEKTVKADSPQIFYSFMNYPLLRDIMTQLNSDIMEQTLLRGEDFQTQMDTLFIFQQSLLVIMLVLIVYVKVYINRKLILFLHLSQYSDSDAISQEINNLKALQDNIQADNSYKFNYQLKLDDKETQLQEQKIENVTRNTKNLKKKKIPPLRFLFVIVLYYCVVSLNSIINYTEFRNYLKKYPATAVYKKQFADLGGDIPLMFAQREVLYGRKNYMYLDAQYFDRMWYYIQESLNRTKLFASVDPDFSMMLVTDQFSTFYKELSTNDLCPFLPEEQQVRAGDLCYITMNQNMKRGFKAMIIYIVNLIDTDMAINNFTFRALPTSNELEGAFMLAELVNVINIKFYDDLITLTTNLVEQQKVFNICYLFILLVVLIIILTQVQKKLYENSRIIIHFVYLIPSQTLFTDDTFERTLRMLLNF